MLIIPVRIINTVIIAVFLALKHSSSHLQYHLYIKQTTHAARPRRVLSVIFSTFFNFPQFNPFTMSQQSTTSFTKWVSDKCCYFCLSFFCHISLFYICCYVLDFNRLLSTCEWILNQHVSYFSQSQIYWLSKHFHIVMTASPRDYIEHIY